MKKIILVEDSYLIRRALVTLLTDDFQVHATDNAHRGLELIDQYGADWLLLNPVLAKNSGLELLYEISSWTDLRPIKTILLTQEMEYFLRYKTVLKELNIVHVLPFGLLNSARLSRILHSHDTSLGNIVA